MAQVFHLPYFGRATSPKQKNPDMHLWCAYPYEPESIASAKPAELKVVMSGASMTTRERQHHAAMRFDFPTVAVHKGRLYRPLETNNGAIFSQTISRTPNRS